MKKKISAFVLTAVLVFLLIPALGQSLTGCTVVFVTPDCDGCDNKDFDTDVKISVFGAHGYEVARTNYTDDVEFEDGSEHAVACQITDSSPSGSSFAQKIIVTISPNGSDDWVFEARVIFTRSNGSTTTSYMRERVTISDNDPTKTLWKR